MKPPPQFHSNLLNPSELTISFSSGSFNTAGQNVDRKCIRYEIDQFFLQLTDDSLFFKSLFISVPAHEESGYDIHKQIIRMKPPKRCVMKQATRMSVKNPDPSQSVLTTNMVYDS